jgi:hypothetical protein
LGHVYALPVGCGLLRLGVFDERLFNQVVERGVFLLREISQFPMNFGFYPHIEYAFINLIGLFAQFLAGL